MAHNPPRPATLSNDAMLRLADEVRPRRLPWRDYSELAEGIIAKARAGKRVVLSPDTAIMIASVLTLADKKPTRDAVALMICQRDCETPCYGCTGRANIIVEAYGCRVQA